MKRFTDTGKWKDPWFRKLAYKYKIFWLYLCDNCDNAGIWVKDIEEASHLICGHINETEVLEKINNEKERIKIISNGRKWLIVDFISFQYGELTEKNMLHRHVLGLLEKQGVSKEDIRGIYAPKEKEKVKEKVKEKDIKEKPKVFPFEEIWAQYPKRVGKKEALRHFNASVKTEQDWKDIQTALKNYLEYLKRKQETEEFIQYGSTWFNNWRDWVNYKKPINREEADEGRFDDGLPKEKPELTEEELKKIHEEAERLKVKIRQKARKSS